MYLTQLTGAKTYTCKNISDPESIYYAPPINYNDSKKCISESRHPKEQRAVSGSVCPFCHKSYSRLNRHVQAVHFRTKHIKCDYCDKRFIQNSDKMRHMRTHKHTPYCVPKIRDTNTTCPYCHKFFASHLKRHITAVHFKLKPYACDLCDWRFGRKTHLVVHMERKHKINMKNCADLDSTESENLDVTLLD
ncbi:protein krueppel-like [Bolinopsis microptera]|uniref:protein krueppel-like n=1 Tax=Bolinopsis microptera TaxID=2820187 RepID=UPI00307AA0C5